MNHLLRRAGALVFVEDLAAPCCSPEDAHHLLAVLRLRPGETVVAADGRGGWLPCRLGPALAGRRRGAEPLPLEPAGEPVEEPPRRPRLLVGFALQKGDRPEWTVQKLTELGVDLIVPLVCERSVVHLDEQGRRRRGERLRRVAREAAAQCRRPLLPELSDPLPFPAALAAAAGAHELALAEPGAPPLAPGVTALLVGPEGGWAPGELEAAPALAGLGPLVLRVETAALAAAALLAHERELSRGG